MALIKCKECSKEVSTTAKVCPHCGAKVPKKTSAFTWTVLVILILIYAFSNNTISNIEENNKQSKEPTVLTQAEKEAIRKQFKPQEKILLAELKKIPASEIYTNKNKYKELLDMFPDNVDYMKKHKYYANKVNELENKIGEKPSVSGWDGIPYSVKNYVEKVAKDPDSVDFTGCTNLVYSDIGWHTTCRFRAKNSFGALSLEQWDFTIRNNIVFIANKE